MTKRLDRSPHVDSPADSHPGPPLTAAAFEDLIRRGHLHEENQRPLSDGERALIESHRAGLAENADEFLREL